MYLLVYLQNYEWYYSEEEEINVKLNIFAVNMEKAYGGKNNLRNQIGLDSDAGTKSISLIVVVTNKTVFEILGLIKNFTCSLK